MKCKSMRVTSRYYDKVTGENWSYEVVASDDELSALEVNMACQRVRMWGSQGLAERLDMLTQPITL